MDYQRFRSPITQMLLLFCLGSTGLGQMRLGLACYETTQRLTVLSLTIRTSLQMLHDLGEEINPALGQQLSIILHYSEALVTGQFRWIFQQKSPQRSQHARNSTTVPAGQGLTTDGPSVSVGAMRDSGSQCPRLLFWKRDGRANHQLTYLSNSPSNACLGNAPTLLPANCPSLKIRRVGMDMI
jgi:hypothetical protein